MKIATGATTWKSAAWDVTNEGSAMKVTRRDLLVWSAGAAAGLMVTPVPWKILDDTSIWSQNWPWIPQPSHVPVETRQSFCSLCPKGCGLRVRMAAGWPVGVAGSTTHPVGGGAICPLAFGAHQLNWHPRRVRQVRHRANESSWRAAQAAFANAAGEGPVAIVDGYPGRAASTVLESFAHKHGGRYRVVLGVEARSLKPYESWTGVPSGSLGYDLENAQTIVSFGAPLLDGWGTPGRFTRLWAENAAGKADPELKLIQVESSLSRTAARSWQWIKIREGSDSVLAAGLAGALLEQKLVPAHGPIPLAPLAQAATETGLSADAIRDLARTMATKRPVLVIGRDENPSVAALNVLLGSVGTRGGVVRVSKKDQHYASVDTAMPDARVVLIDSSVPWNFNPKTGGEIFRFAAWDGGGSNADWLLPAPGFLEELMDIPTAPTSSVETYAVAPALVKATTEVQSAAQFLANLDSNVPAVEKVIQARCEGLYRSRAGTLYGQEKARVADLASVDKLKEQLWKGDVWASEFSPPGNLHCNMREWPVSVDSERVQDWSAGWAAPVLPPLASKLYIESSLREAPERRKA